MREDFESVPFVTAAYDQENLNYTRDRIGLQH